MPISKLVPPEKAGDLFVAYFPEDYMACVPSLKAEKYVNWKFPPAFVMTSRNDYLRMIRKGDTVLELFIKPEAPARVNNPEAKGLRHLAFHVEDIEPAVAWLNSLGIETEPVREDKVNGGRFTFFKDPDGLPLELHE